MVLLKLHLGGWPGTSCIAREHTGVIRGSVKAAICNGRDEMYTRRKLESKHDRAFIMDVRQVVTLSSELYAW